MRKLVKIMKQVNMIMLMMRSALGYPELGSAFDYRDTLLCLKSGQHKSKNFLAAQILGPRFPAEVRDFSGKY
jgi:hypothetical protein